MSKEHSEGEKHLLTYQYFITGKVQGVGYRRFAQKQALAMGLKGWARNRLDGSVEVMVQGSADQAQAFAEKLQQGPAFSVVQKVQAQTLEKNQFADFEIYPDEDSAGGSQ